MNVRIFLLLALVPVSATAQTCYTSGYADCSELNASLKHDCDEYNCVHLEHTLALMGCESAARQLRDTYHTVQVAVHSNYGYDSHEAQGGTIYCGEERDCYSGNCGYTFAPGTCTNPSSGAWTDAEPYVDTVPTGNICNLQE